jgi:biopolymer transport protein TolR
MSSAARSGGNAGGRGRRARRLNSHINVVPYIDVMLVLLVIFMVTAPLMAPGVVDLPKVSNAATTPAVALEVVLQKDGSLKLVDRDATRAAEMTVNLDSLAQQAQGRMRTGEDRPVVIAADKGVVYEQVLAVMDALKTAGVQRVGLSVAPKPAAATGKP